MRSTDAITRSCRLRTIILIGVIACLCFSVGEGLRLTPFPVSPLAETGAKTVERHVSTLFETSLRKYGPLDVPTRAQSRGKRQAVDFGYPPSQSNRELADPQVWLAYSSKPLRIVSHLSGSHLSGRPPPSGA